MGRPKKENGMSATDYKREFNEKAYDRINGYVKQGKKAGTKRRRTPWGAA